MCWIVTTSARCLMRDATCVCRQLGHTGPKACHIYHLLGCDDVRVCGQTSVDASHVCHKKAELYHMNVAYSMYVFRSMRLSVALAS